MRSWATGVPFSDRTMSMSGVLAGGGLRIMNEPTSAAPGEGERGHDPGVRPRQRHVRRIPLPAVAGDVRVRRRVEPRAGAGGPGGAGPRRGCGRRSLTASPGSARSMGPKPPTWCLVPVNGPSVTSTSPPENLVRGRFGERGRRNSAEPAVDPQVGH
ncbi:hypothetical protein ACTIVE_0654 [Actinomadura verrucosospora]|uniref:Uncharacterized protein n=1 Tax=Actinomadura verrucosospora TaxID=46165 RepID=A0A7D3VNY3_ACTVE|nr:hypothetical protein ACTIVE_0654 [Actinomadura verrucosospora]